MANYRAARAFLGKGKISVEEGRQKIRGEEGEGPVFLYPAYFEHTVAENIVPSTENQE